MQDKKEIFRNCFASLDLTTLRPEDTPSSIKALVAKVSNLQKEYPTYPLPASICVYPNFAAVVRDTRPSKELDVTCVAGCFPSSQSYLEVKLHEVKLALENGADEIDVVLALNAFLDGDENRARNEIRAFRELTVGKTLKVILETGVLKTPELIRSASLLAMEEGADFIKTSTGKVAVNATPEAARVMCEAIREYYLTSGRKVGFKASGGVSTADEALVYWNIAEEVLGEEWLSKKYFRLGVSRLANSLMSAIEGKEVKYF